jgi:hypothetical protein
MNTNIKGHKRCANVKGHKWLKYAEVIMLSSFPVSGSTNGCILYLLKHMVPKLICDSV